MEVNFIVNIGKSAKKDIEEIYHYIFNTYDDINSAKRIVDSIIELCKSLRFFPERYPSFKYEQKYKYAPCGNYLIFYEIDFESREVKIVAVLSSLRDKKLVIKNYK